MVYLPLNKHVHTCESCPCHGQYEKQVQIRMHAGKKQVPAYAYQIASGGEAFSLFFFFFFFSCAWGCPCPARPSQSSSPPAATTDPNFANHSNSLPAIGGWARKKKKAWGSTRRNLGRSRRVWCTEPLEHANQKIGSSGTPPQTVPAVPCYPNKHLIRKRKKKVTVASEPKTLIVMWSMATHFAIFAPYWHAGSSPRLNHPSAATSARAGY